MRQETHEKLTEVVAFLNEVEKKKGEKNEEEDAIAMLDDLIEEDKHKKEAETVAAPPAAEPAEEGPRDIVALLEKLQKLIEVRRAIACCLRAPDTRTARTR